MPAMRELGYTIEAGWHRHVLCRLGRHSWDGWFRLVLGMAEEHCCFCGARRPIEAVSE